MNTRTRFSLVFASWFTLVVLVLAAVLSSSLFTSLDALQFFLGTTILTPLGLVVGFPFLFCTGFLLGEIAYIFLPWYQTLKHKQLIIVLIILTFSLFLAYENHINSQPDYTNYTAKNCQNLNQSWYTSRYINKKACFYYVAKERRDPFICNNLGENELESFSKNFCLEEVSRLKKDPSICELITNYRKDDCYSNLLLCKQVTDPSRKEQCNSSRVYQEKHPSGY
ncbi:MAG TPA: hypothetical protein VGO21_05115 [Candidatus Paceibacterota bacterium]|jgi:hypothetical protein|nr:hypothetical protein [Candidatus Paceibacterota bacterium]